MLRDVNLLFQSNLNHHIVLKYFPMKVIIRIFIKYIILLISCDKACDKPKRVCIYIDYSYYYYLKYVRASKAFQKEVPMNKLSMKLYEHKICKVGLSARNKVKMLPTPHP